MVELPATFVEWQRCPPQGTRHDNRHRYLPDRLGSSLQQCAHGRTVVTSGEESPHQPSGASSGLLCSAVLYKRQTEHTCPPSNGQQLLCQQDWGDPLPKSNRTSLPSMVVVSAEENNLVGRVSTWNKQLGSGQRVSPGTDLSRMETRRRGVQKRVPDVWAISGGSICFMAQQPAREIRELETRPLCYGNQCTTDQPVRADGLCLSSICSDSLQKIRTERCTVLLITPCWRTQP